MKRKLIDNLRRVEDRIGEACARAGRRRTDVTMVAVTKSVGLDVIRTLIDMGVTDLGENRVQEFARRAGMVREWLKRRGLDRTGPPPPQPRWHMIGHLQRNKVKQLLPFVDVVHSVDSLRLAEEIDLQSRKLGRVTPILLQVNAADEPQKTGVVVAAVTHLAEQLHTLPNLELRGLMAMAPLTDDQSVIRFTFGRMRELFAEIVHERLCGPEFCELSMGMTQDFELAIEAGATIVRIGTALFEGVDAPAGPVAMEARGE